MMTIGELNIQLPEEFRFRAQKLAQLTAIHLAKSKMVKPLSIDSIDLPTLQLDMQQTDERISVKIAEAILIELKHRL